MSGAPKKPAPKESFRKCCQNRHTALKNERSSWIDHWRELSDYVLPRRSRFFQTDRNRGTKKNQNIINGTATRAVNILASGMMAGITSPARPWFRLSTVDPTLSENMGVRSWLHIVEERIRETFAKSNLYNALATMYPDLGLFGTAAALIEEDDQDVIRTYVFPVGQYCLAVNGRQQVDTLFRDVTLTVRQCVSMFGQENCSSTVKNAYDTGRLDDAIEVVHVITPNEDMEETRGDYRGKPWASCWYEKSSPDGEDKFLRRSGYEENPILAPRWNVVGEDVYGNSPGMDALGDVKGLHLLEKRKLELVDKLSRPPMKGPSALANKTVSLVPGSFTAVDTYSGGATLEPAMVVNPAALVAIREELGEVQQRINGYFLADLWLMLSQSSTTMTAREVDERHEEKMLQLGPVLERLHDELLSPIIERTFGILLRRGMLPKPPPELQGLNLKIEFISVAAQAQKLLGTAGIERLIAFVGNLAGSKPEVLDKLNTDEIVDEYASLLGTKPDLVNPDDMVAAMRQARAQQQQQAMAMQQAATAAQGAKVLSQADTSGDNALTRLVGNLGSGAGVTAAQG